MSAELRRTLVAAVVLGIVAAAVVWWLERYEVARLHVEVQRYMRNHDAFREWLTDQEGAT